MADGRGRKSKASSSSKPGDARKCTHGRTQAKCCCSANYAPKVAAMQCMNCDYLFKEPYDCKEDRDHVVECSKQARDRKRQVIASTKVCEICKEKPMEKLDRRFGLLPNCFHCFCFKCIKNWRLSHPTPQGDFYCPICEIDCDTICPLGYWVDNDSEKQRVIAEYKERCKNIECKYFRYGSGICKCWNKCVYAHTFGMPVEHTQTG